MEPVNWVGFEPAWRREQFQVLPAWGLVFIDAALRIWRNVRNAAKVLPRTPSSRCPLWNWTSLRNCLRLSRTRHTKASPTPSSRPRRPGVDGAQPLDRRDALTDALVGPKVIVSIYKETVYEAFGPGRPVDYSVSPPQVQNNLDPKWVPMGGGDRGFSSARPTTTCTTTSAPICRSPTRRATRSS